MTVGRAVLASLPLAGRIVTGDAKFCQRDLSALVVAKGGDYFWVVKENQPSLLADLVTLFDQPPPGEVFARHVSRTRHGDRQEVRTILVSTALTGYLLWPGVRSVCRIERQVTRKTGSTREIAYAVTSLSAARASAAQLQTLWRGHWGIENRLHWVRDVTFGEDASQVRTGSGPQVMAALRNTAIAILRGAGYENIAAALRTLAGRPHEILRLTGLL